MTLRRHTDRDKIRTPSVTCFVFVKVGNTFNLRLPEVTNPVTETWRPRNFYDLIVTEDLTPQSPYDTKFTQGRF